LEEDPGCGTASVSVAETIAAVSGCSLRYTPKRAPQPAPQGSVSSATRNKTKQEQPNAKPQKGGHFKRGKEEDILKKRFDT